MILSNLHTHSIFCDGKSAPEEIVVTAIEKGFASLGFSGHGYTPFDLRSCMKDTDGYILEIERLKEKYKKDIQIYLGVEEDAACPTNRKRFDYIIGSSHYFLIGGEYLSIDYSYSCFEKCLTAFNNNAIELASTYYTEFCKYIKARKPDIIGHFDLITKYDETSTDLFLKNEQYNSLAEGFILDAASSGCIFEVNTGAISRGYRSAPYPAENLLYLLKKHDTPITLTSDSHRADTIDFEFEKTRRYLRDIGFRHAYVLIDGRFARQEI